MPVSPPTPALRGILLIAATLLVTTPAPARSQDAPSSEAAAQEGTPEQRYSDWVRRLDFRPQEYAFRRSNMIRLLRSSGGGVMLIPSSDGRTEGDTFRQLEDFWYYTGLEVPRSVLVLDAEQDRSILFLPSSDTRFESPGRPNDFPGRPLLDDYRLRSIGGIEEYRDMTELEGYLSGLVRSRTLLRVNGGAPGSLVEPDVPFFGGLGPVEAMILRIRRDHPRVRLANAFEEVALGRMVKSRYEIEKMRIAADATSLAIRAAAAEIAAGTSERSIQGVFESMCRDLGAQSIPFTPIVKSGPNSLWPWRILAAHYDRRNRPFESGDLVILDVGCEIDGYVSDVGRTFPVGGSFTPIQREKLELSTAVADAVIAAVRPGITFAELTEIAYDAIPDHEERYMQTSSFFGHHIGLAAGDPALPGEPLTPGMVFTVEPWYYNHDEGIAVFVEDVVLVTEDGVEVLTRDLPRSPDILQEMVR